MMKIGSTSLLKKYPAMEPHENFIHTNMADKSYAK